MVDLAVKLRDRLSPDTLNIASLVGFNFLAVAQYVAGDQSFLRASQLSDPNHEFRLDGHTEVLRVVDSVASSDGFDRFIEAMHNSDPTAMDPLAGKAAIIANFPATLVHGDHYPITAVGSHLESVEATRRLMTQPSSVALQQMPGHDDAYAGGHATRHSTLSSSTSQSEHSSLQDTHSQYGTENAPQSERHGSGTADHVPDQTTSHGVSTSNLLGTSAVLLTAGSMLDTFDSPDRAVQSEGKVDRISSSDTVGNAFVYSSTSIFSGRHTTAPLQINSQTPDVGLGAVNQDTDNDSSAGSSPSFADQTSVSVSDSSAVSKSSYSPFPMSTENGKLGGGISGSLSSTAGFSTAGTLLTPDATKPTTITPIEDHDPAVQKVTTSVLTSVPPVVTPGAGSGSSSVGGDGHSGVGTVSGVTIDPTESGSSSTSGTVAATGTTPTAGAGGSGIAGSVVPPIDPSNGGTTLAGGVSGPGTTGSTVGATTPSHVDGGAGDQSGGAHVGGTQGGGSSASTATGTVTDTGTGSPSGTVANPPGGVPGSVADHHAVDTGGGQAGAGTGAGSGSSSVGGDGHSGVDPGTGLLQGDALAQLRDNLLKQISGLLDWHSNYTTSGSQTTENPPQNSPSSPIVVHQIPGNGDGGNPMVAHPTSDIPHIDGGAVAQERADLMRLHDTLMQQAFDAEAKIQASVTYTPQVSANSAAVPHTHAEMMAPAHPSLDLSFHDEQSPATHSELHNPASGSVHHDNLQEQHQINQDLHVQSYDEAHHFVSHPSHYDHF